MKYLYAILILVLNVNLLLAADGIEGCMDISADGIYVQQIKMKVIAENIANIHTTKTDEGGPYKKKSVVVRETKDSIKVSQIKQDESDPIRVYEPNHPDADKNGFVNYPNISVSKEMTDLAYISKMYESNVVVYNAAKNMAMQMINLGK